MTQTPSGNGVTSDAGLSATDTLATDETSGTKLPQSIDDALKQVESLQAALKAANKESAGHRIKAKELDELKAKVEADKLSETEKLQKALTEKESHVEAMVNQLINAEIRLQAAAMGFNPKILHRIPGMLDWSEIEADEQTGEITNVEKLLKSLKEEMADVPGFFSGRSTATSGGATNPSRTAATQVGEITMSNLSEAMNRYNELSEAQKQQVQRLLINRR